MIRLGIGISTDGVREVCLCVAKVAMMGINK